jgi:hypothetical protein
MSFSNVSHRRETWPAICGALRDSPAVPRVKVLLDECVPWPMHKLLTAHDCTTAQKRGWSGLENGDLLRRAEGEFDLFIASDQNLRYQLNLTGRKIAILELSKNDLSRSARLAN